MALNPFPLPAIEPGAGFACWSESIELVTTTAPEFIDLTDQVESIIARIWGREAADDFLANAMTLLGAAALLALTGLLLYGLFSAARWLLRLRKP